jgi:hypothetical protein
MTATEIIAKANETEGHCFPDCLAIELKKKEDPAKLVFGIYQSAAGFYIGRFCPECGPFDRQSGYFETREKAEEYLEKNAEMFIEI